MLVCQAALQCDTSAVSMVFWVKNIRDGTFQLVDCLGLQLVAPVVAYDLLQLPPRAALTIGI